MSVEGVLDAISSQNTVLKSVCDSVAFSPAVDLAWNLWNYIQVTWSIQFPVTKQR